MVAERIFAYKKTVNSELTTVLTDCANTIAWLLSPPLLMQDSRQEIRRMRVKVLFCSVLIRTFHPWWPSALVQQAVTRILRISLISLITPFISCLSSLNPPTSARQVHFLNTGCLLAACFLPAGCVSLSEFSLLFLTFFCLTLELITSDLCCILLLFPLFWLLSTLPLPCVLL